MKSFDQLTAQERADALLRAKNLLIAHLYEGVIELDMPNSTLDKVLKDQLGYARLKNSVDVLNRLIAGYPPIQKEVDKISIAAAQGSMYTESGFAIM